MSRSLKHLSRPLKAILLILLIIAIISAVFLSRELNKYARGSRSYTQIAQQVLPERLTPLPDATAEPTIPPGNTQVSNTVTVAPPPRPTLSSLEMELRQVGSHFAGRL